MKLLTIEIFTSTERGQFGEFISVRRKNHGINNRSWNMFYSSKMAMDHISRTLKNDLQRFFNSQMDPKTGQYTKSKKGKNQNAG